MSTAPLMHHWLIGKARPAAEARAERDPRVDVIRGLALLMIFVNHIPGNPLSQATLAAFTFHDAAEVFVLLAGYSAMLAYHRGFAAGPWAGAKPILRRVRTIYQAQVALALLLTVLGLALAAATGRAFYLNHLELSDFAEAPLQGTLALFALLFQPSYVDILPMYVVLMGSLPLVIAGLRRSPLATLAISIGLHAGSNIVGLNLPQVFDSAWFFNPFAWQLIFVVGAAAAHATLTGVRLPRHVDGVILSLGVVAFAAAVKAPWTALGLDGGFFTTLGVNHLDFSKTWAHPLRLASLFALAYLVAALIDPRASWLRSRAAGRLQALGQVSLPAFALGTILSFLGASALLEFGSGWIILAAVNAAGIALLLALPAALQASAKLRPVRPAGAAAPAAAWRRA
jgi:hypothetical protein